MPNTKSAERRMRNSARKNLHNRSIKSSLHTLEKRYLELLVRRQEGRRRQTTADAQFRL